MSNLLYRVDTNNNIDVGTSSIKITDSLKFENNSNVLLNLNNTDIILGNNGSNLNLNFNSLSLNGSSPNNDTEQTLVYNSNHSYEWRPIVTDISEVTDISTNASTEVTLGNNLVDLDVNANKLNFNINNNTPSDHDVLRYSHSKEGVEWSPLIGETKNNEVLDVYCHKYDTSLSYEGITFPKINELRPVLSTDPKSINLFTFTKNPNVDKIIIDFTFLMYDTNLYSQLELNLKIKNIVVNNIYLKSLSANRSTEINRTFVVDKTDIPEGNSTFTLDFINKNSSGVIQLFGDNNNVENDDDRPYIVVKTIGTKNMTYGSSINNLPIGNVTPSTGEFTNLTANVVQPTNSSSSTIGTVNDTFSNVYSSNLCSDKLELKKETSQNSDDRISIQVENNNGVDGVGIYSNRQVVSGGPYTQHTNLQNENFEYKNYIKFYVNDSNQLEFIYKKDGTERKITLSGNIIN